MLVGLPANRHTMCDYGFTYRHTVRSTHRHTMYVQGFTHRHTMYVYGFSYKTYASPNNCNVATRGDRVRELCL